MSGIQLSSELVSDVKSIMVKHDPEAGNDLLFMQYLSAVTGYVLAQQTQPGFDKQGFLGDISTFTGQVLTQMEQDMKTKAPEEDAFGIWKPE